MINPTLNDRALALVADIKDVVSNDERAVWSDAFLNIVEQHFYALEQDILRERGDD